MMRKKNRTEAVPTIDAVKDLLITSLLPSRRKLKHFKQQPSLGMNNITPQHLILWAFEDFVKSYYFEFLQIVDERIRDTVLFVRNHMITHVQELLKEKPEQEKNLLSMLVNKLGDLNKTISSKSSYFILQLEKVHPAMKGVIVSSLGDFLFSQSLSQAAQQMTLVTLNQTVLQESVDQNVADKLFDIYLAYFSILVHKQEEIAKAAELAKANKMQKKRRLDNGNHHHHNRHNHRHQKQQQNKSAEKVELDEGVSKLISSVLTGANRAFPYSSKKVNVDKYLPSLFKICKTGGWGTIIQSLNLIFQIGVAHKTPLTNFYSALYASLLDMRLVNSSLQTIYLNLLYKALNHDTNGPRLKAFIKRILQICQFHQPSFVCGSFFLLSNLDKKIIQRDGLRWVNTAGPVDDGKIVEKYDALCPDPKQSGAETTLIWELVPYLNHYHPSVLTAAQHYHDNEKSISKPDLEMFSTTNFLNTFLNEELKKPKVHGDSLMQPRRVKNLTGVFTHGDVTIELPQLAQQSKRMLEDDSDGSDGPDCGSD